MLIKYQALHTHLQKQLNSVYLLLGNDPYLLNDAAVQIKQAFLKKHTDVSQAIIDIQSPADWSLLMSEANSYSLFTDQILLDARFEKKSIDATGKSELTSYLTSINEQCLMLLRAPQLSTKSIQWLMNDPNVVVVQIYTLTTPALIQWIDLQLQAKNIRVEQGITHLIHQFTQGNMLATAQFIEKLALCVKPGEMITLPMVREQLSDQSHFDVYALAEACLNGNADQCIRLLKQFEAERIEPTLILWILTQEIRQLIQLHYLLNQNMTMDNACQQLKIWNSRTSLYSKAVKRLSVTTLLAFLSECKLVDELIKTSQTLQIWHQFDCIALSLCGVKKT